MSSLRVIGSKRYGTLSPLRYPGGKAALAGVFTDIIRHLGLHEPCYVEPYAGGAGAGIALLREGVADHLVINDIDPAVHAFWASVTQCNANLIELVKKTPLTVDEWHRQREIYKEASDQDQLALGFSFFYLNRTNRSGILNAGVIGGQDQRGNYKMDARFNRDALITRLELIGTLAHRITVSDLDGRTVILNHAADPNTFMYIDPPYVQAGKRLYLNAFGPRDHEALARVITDTLNAHWLVTYDADRFVQRLFQDHFQCVLELTYSAHRPGRHEELLVASQDVATVLKTMSLDQRQVLPV